MQERYDWAAQWAVYGPDKVAVKEHETGRTLTYGAMNQLADRLAKQLSKTCALKKGDRIVVLSENRLEYFLLFALAQKTGAVLVPLNYRLATPEIDYLLQDAQPQLLIVEQALEDKLRTASQPESIPHHLSMDDLERMALLAEDSDHSPASLQPDDPIFILYTSGTTGHPKGAIYTHRMLFWNSINTALSLVVNADSRTVNCMPPFHTGGWNVLVTPFLHRGGYVCIMKKFDPAALLRTLEEERATLFIGVPTMLKMIADLPDFPRADFSQLLYLIVGGEPMPIPLIEQWQAKGVAVRQGYGMTEIGPNLTSLHQSDAVRKKGSIGRPNFYVQIRIVDSDGKDCPHNTPGELLLRGPMMTPGYWRNPAATQEAIRAGWFHTGDMVQQDEEGYLYVVDRIKNMFISGGENVYPAEVERVLMAHPAVSEAAVIGCPDEQWGEVGKAFIVSYRSFGVDSLNQHCRAHLAKYKVPKYFISINTLPKNDTGKIDRITLKKMN